MKVTDGHHGDVTKYCPATVMFVVAADTLDLE